MRVVNLPSASERMANANSIATSCQMYVCDAPFVPLKWITWSMINLPMYSIDTGIAERSKRMKAVASVSEGLVCHTSPKNCGMFFSAEKRSFNVGSAMAKGVSENDKYIGLWRYQYAKAPGKIERDDVHKAGATVVGAVCTKVKKNTNVG